MEADKGKKLKVEEEDAEQIDEDLVLSIERLQEIQDELEKIDKDARDELVELEKKYSEIREPVVEERTEIMTSIPNFWLTVIMNHAVLSELVTEEDHKIFKHLTTIEVDERTDMWSNVKSEYSITFSFSSNPYFENSELTKTFTTLDEGTTKVTATFIRWKEGSGVPNGVDVEKKGNKRAHTEESFFNWFSETTKQSDDVAEIIKDLWANPLTYFNNEADKEDSEEDDDKGSSVDENE